MCYIRVIDLRVMIGRFVSSRREKDEMRVVGKMCKLSKSEIVLVLQHGRIDA